MSLQSAPELSSTVELDAYAVLLHNLVPHRRSTLI